MAASELKSSSQFEFILHVIPPPMKLDWSTPRSLFMCTFLNHARMDKAPIGHLNVDFTLKDGRRVLTGMSRQKMNVFESLRLVQGKKLGLGTFYYDFKGKLDAATDARKELVWADARKRHATIRVLLTEEKAQALTQFMSQWIEHGSFLHYSGGLRVDCGEGAGCAEFGMHFLSMALGVRAIHPDWMRRVRVPSEFIGGGFAGHSEKVGLWKLVNEGDRWAFNNEDHRVYSIPDPELMFDWIKDRVISVGGDLSNLNITLTANDVTWGAGEFIQSDFNVKYPRESAESVQEQWSRITEK